MIRLMIELTDEGTVRVEGPLENRILCLGILSMAEEAIKNSEPKLIQPACEQDIQNTKIS
jgi:hypothetical protein